MLNILRYDFVRIFLLIALLSVGALTTKIDDPIFFECYANSFWGKDTLIQLKNGGIFDKCYLHGKFNYPPPSKYPMPFEYPFLTLLPFSFPLLLPLNYVTGFMILMAVFVMAIYFCLKKYGPKNSHQKFLLYLAVGAFATSLVRFDLIVALLLLATVMAALRKKFMLSYTFLALAAGFKFYPILLSIPLFIFEQKQLNYQPILIRFKNIGIFISTILFVFGISVLINFSGTLKPVEFFLQRPIQIESLPAAVIYILTIFLKIPFCLKNITGAAGLYEHVDKACTLLTQNPLYTNTILVVFELIFISLVVLIIYFQIKNKLNFIASFILILMSILLTNKVLNPQYFIWLIPLITLVLKSKLQSMIFLIILLLTSLIYPFLYGANIILVQNITILIFVIIIRDLLLIIFFYKFFKSQLILTKESKT